MEFLTQGLIFDLPSPIPIDRDHFQLIARSTKFGWLAVLLLMLMLMQVKGPNRNHYQTPLKQSTVRPKQVEYDDRLLRQI